jgi:putative RecB family exonuclease
MRTSYSALNTYQQCPLKFKFQEIDRIRVTKGIEAVFGNIVHDCLKFMFERSPLYPTQDEVINRFQNLWQVKEVANLNPTEEKAYFEDGIATLKNFYRLNQPWNFNVLDLESRFEVLIPDLQTGENHILAGIIDRIDKISDDGIYEIIDYKTSRRLPSQEIMDRDLQMSIYHLGILKRWPHISPENVKLSLYFLKHGEKITTGRSLADLENTKASVIGLISEIKKRMENNFDFPPYPSPLCGWCGYKPMCPMWKHQYASSQQKIDSGQIENIIKEYFELKEQSTKNSKRLAELGGLVYGFMNSEGVERVFGESGYLTKTLGERFVYDMDKIKKILEEIGRWDEVSQKKQFLSLKATKKKAGA